MLKKNIVHLTSVHPSFDTRIFCKECRSLVDAGYHVTLIAPHTHEETVQGVRILAMPSVKNRINRMTIRTMNIYRLAKQLNADIYHFHDPELIPIGLALQIGGYNVVYDIHEDVPRALLSSEYYYLPQYSRRAISLFLEFLEDFSARRFNACIAATPHIADRFRNIQKNTFCINNYPILNELRETKEIKWDERQNFIAYVGGLAMTRGLGEMVQAMEYLPANLGARLKLAGVFSPSNCRMHVEKMRGWCSVDEQGFLNRTDIGRLLAKVKAGLVIIHPEPRYIVSQPTKLYEFMSAGIPVIASDFPLWRKLIEREMCGLVVDPLDPRAIAAAIEYLLTHDREAEDMGRRGRQAIEQKYNWQMESEKLLHIYRNILINA